MFNFRIYFGKTEFTMWETIKMWGGFSKDLGLPQITDDYYTFFYRTHFLCTCKFLFLLQE